MRGLNPEIQHFSLTISISGIMVNLYVCVNFRHFRHNGRFAALAAAAA
jgi:hypothetical protein